MSGRYRRCVTTMVVAALMLCGPVTFVVSQVPPDDPVAGLDQPGESPRIAPEDELGSGARVAANPTGPRTIPHRIRGQQLNVNVNRCLACHGPDAPDVVHATPMPATHFLDRDGERHARLAGGRYVCTTCHVPQLRMAAER